MDEQDPRDGESTGEGDEGPLDTPADEQDPESSAASSPPPGQEPGESKSHDL